jgi:GT2 family glycosyltransferase
VTYNNEDKIEKLIDNLENVTSNMYTFDIYVVDNGSDDDTVDLIKNKKKEFKNIELIIPIENKGFGAGNNAVIPNLSSDYHILINPDIIIKDTNQIQKMVEFMENNRDVGLLSPKILNVDGTIQKLYKHNPSVLDMALRFISPKIMTKRQLWFVHNETGYAKMGPIEHASGAFMFFRTGIFKSIQGFDERYFMYMEDADITRKVNAISSSVFFPEAMVVHEWQRDSHKKIKYTFMTISSMVKYFNKWGWKLW